LQPSVAVPDYILWTSFRIAPIELLSSLRKIGCKDHGRRHKIFTSRPLNTPNRPGYRWEASTNHTELPMPQEATLPSEGFADRVPSKKQPIVLYDDGHGNKLKIWNNIGRNGDFTNATLEHSYKDAEEKFQTQRVSINEKHYSALAEGFAKAAEMVEARRQSQGQSR
jgi:hypothetical protein